MPSEPTLRPAVRSDLRAVGELFWTARTAAAPVMPASVHSRESVLDFYGGLDLGGRREVWLAEDADGALIGFLHLADDWLDDLYVHPAHQRDGVGSALLGLARALRPAGFELWVFAANTPARAFYARHGLLELETTDGSANEERAPDVRLAWPGSDPLGFLRARIDAVDLLLGDLLARRAALTRAVQHTKGPAPRDPDREADIVRRVAALAPELGEQRVARIVETIIGESLDAAREARRTPR